MNISRVFVMNVDQAFLRGNSYPKHMLNHKHPYQVTVMNESESMGLQESPRNQFFSPQDDSHYEVEENQNLIFDQNFEESEKEDKKENNVAGPLTSPLEKNEKDARRKKEQKQGYTAQFEAFKNSFEAQTDLEIKLQCAVDFMESSLSQGGTPHFRSFWEARRLCLPLFKENISPVLRSQLWAKYSELSKEARRLKEILDEQSAFAVEQIEIAIQALEKEISQLKIPQDQSPFPEALTFPQVLKEHFDIYQNLQGQLNILNAHASRINDLRKGLLRTEMRVRHKNKFFQRLSTAGDLVFPKRKELIKEISQQFSDDVERFIKMNFGTQTSHESLYILREDIKALQSLAKVLTLNTHSFTQTRTHLSECWDQIKVEEKERKKERAHQKILFKQNSDIIENQIQTLKEILEKNEETPSEVQKKIENVLSQMRKMELGREEQRMLREKINELRKISYEKIKIEEELRKEQENERNRLKKEKYKVFRNEVEQMLKTSESQDADQLIYDRDAFLDRLQDSSMTKIEKQEIERLLKPLRDIITEKKEKIMMNLSEGDRQTLQQLLTILKQRKERRQEIKNQLEILRKAAGSSSLDFEKAISYTTQINEEKERLEKANQAIQEIERKISEVQIKMKE